jgi:hypothetical protein
LVDDNSDGVTNYVSIGDGLSVRVTVTSGELDINDTFTFKVKPDNRVFSISVEGGAATIYTMLSATYDNVTDFVTAFNALISGGGEDYLMVEYTLDDG